MITMRGGVGARRAAEMRALGIITDGALLIVDGVIQQVGTSRRVEKLAAARDAEEIDASGKVVMPGFVDCQTHLLSPPAPLDAFEARCLEGRLRGAEASEEHLRILRGYSAQRLMLEGKRNLRVFWRYGTTTLGSTTGAGLLGVSEWRALRILNELNEQPLHIAASFGEALGIGPGYSERRDEYIAWLGRVILPQVRQKKLARRVDVAIGEGAFTAEAAHNYARAARDLGLNVSVRLRSATAELPDCLTSVSGVQHLSSGAARLRDSPTVAVLTPGVTFHSGDEVREPARELIDSGAAVALSTGFNTQESPSCSMPMAMALACAQLRMAPAETMVAATINGAHALGLGAQTGSLETGKWADLLMMDASDYREIPLQFGVNLLTLALRRGQTIYPRLESE